MKRPYLTQFERQLIAIGTLKGDFIMLRFRVKQLEKALIKSHTMQPMTHKTTNPDKIFGTHNQWRKYIKRQREKLNRLNNQQPKR